MRIYIVFILIFTINSLKAQEIGIINDPDGYTNIRSGQGTNFETVGTIREAEKFKFYPSDKSKWWKIETMPSYSDPIIGYVHSSRIQNFAPDNSIDCKCKIDDNEYGSADLIATIGDQNIIVCGYLLQRFSNDSIKISEFSVTDCNANKMLKFYGAVDTYIVSKANNQLNLYKLDRLPVGKNFKWIDAVYSKSIISLESGIPQIQKEQIIIDLSDISTNEVSAFEQSLSNYKNIGHFAEIESFIGKLTVCALKGSEICEEKLYNLQSFINYKLDGHLLEDYSDAVRIAKERNAP